MIIEIEENTLLINVDEGFEPIIHVQYKNNGHVAELASGFENIETVMLDLNSEIVSEDFMDEMLITMIDYHGEKRVRQLLDLWGES